uniref:DUF2345 domain-containing protein n=1 Tax=Chitinolyticbacter albus TaxID=2961951 RepID=UPI002109E3DD
DKVNLKLIAAKGHVNLQAQSGDVEVVGDKSLRIFANKEKLEVVAKEELLLTCGGAYIRLKGGNIEVHAPSSESFKGASYSFTGPDSLQPPELQFPNGVCESCILKALEAGSPFAAKTN